jgi:hypothetical protein
VRPDILVGGDSGAAKDWLERIHGNWKHRLSSHRHGRACPGHDGDDTIPIIVNAL